LSYIGNSLTQQSFTGGVDQFNGNASNTAFGLTRTINTVYDVDVYVENVWQRPGVGYNVSANTITFTSAPSAGSNNVVVVYRNFTATSVVPVQGSVTTSSFAANAIPATLGYVPANKDGDTFTGAVVVNNAISGGNTTVNGTLNVTGNVTISSIATQNTAYPSWVLNRASTSAQSDIRWKENGSNKWAIGQSVATVGSQLDFYNYDLGGNALKLDTNGLVTLPQGQLKFPATQNASSDANTLDDYEEGTWTPSIGSLTWSQVYGRYVKVGQIVYADFSLNTSSAGSSAFSIGGLPFAAAANTAGQTEYYAGTCELPHIGNFSLTSPSYGIFGRINAGTTSIQILSTGGGTHTSAYYSMSTGGTIRGSIVYRAAS
jgi:hypothetical protein